LSKQYPRLMGCLSRVDLTCSVITSNFLQTRVAEDDRVSGSSSIALVKSSKASFSKPMFVKQRLCEYTSPQGQVLSQLLSYPHSTSGVQAPLGRVEYFNETKKDCSCGQSLVM
jgi:hypothetical protein